MKKLLKIKSNMPKSKLTNSLIGIFFLVLQFSAFGQITSPNNTNNNGGFHNSELTGFYNVAWIYDIKQDNAGNIVHCGYVDSSGSNYLFQHPSIVKRTTSGTLIWEKTIDCVIGFATNIIEVPGAYIVFGEGTRYPGCADIQGIFSFAVDKSTGDMLGRYGLKFYNEQYNPFPRPALNVTPFTTISSRSDARNKFCPILNTSGIPTGIMICGNFEDGKVPNFTSQQYSHGSFLLKIDTNGTPDPNFGSAGLQLFNKSATGQYYNSHFLSVCVNYNNGNPANGILGYAVAGYRAENISVTPASSPSYVNAYDTDAFILKVNTAGNVVWEDVFDDMTHQKQGLALSYVYTDRSDNPVCASCCSQPALDNNNERAVRISQDAVNGDFIVCCQFDYAQHVYSSPCANTYPSAGFRLLADPAVLRFNALNGTVMWATNLNESTGADFENDMIIDQPNATIYVSGSTQTEPAGSPTEQRAIVSSLDLNTGIIGYERTFINTTSSQTMFCPFTMCFDGTNGILLGGDADGAVAGDYYEIIKVIK